MENITRIDANFSVKTEIAKRDIHFYDPKQSPFCIYGVTYEDGCYRRMPETVARTVSEGVLALHLNTAGGRVRFRTDSAYVAIYAKMSHLGRMSHFALTGSMGFDLYAGEGEERYIKSFIPPYDMEDGYESIIEFDSQQMQNITINFPLYSGVTELYIGLQKDAKLFPPLPYKHQKPVVFYGSSITQGGCASRPGNAYPAILSRKLNFDYINLGFSGSAKAEDEIVDYIKNMEMSVFVYDYDHNAPSVEHLENTHEKMFRAIRQEKPALPIIIMSCPEYTLSLKAKQKFPVVRKTYENAIKRGDKNVYFLSGRELMTLAKDDGTVDACHPNDWGFISMATAVEPVLRNVLENREDTI